MRKRRKRQKRNFKTQLTSKNEDVNMMKSLLKRWTSSLKTERNKQRETSIFILDARQTNFIGEFDPGSG